MYYKLFDTNHKFAVSSKSDLAIDRKGKRLCWGTDEKRSQHALKTGPKSDTLRGNHPA